MTNTIEISKSIFNKLVSINHMPTRIENSELARKTYFDILDMKLLQIENFISETIQYYIQDINA